MPKLLEIGNLDVQVKAAVEDGSIDFNGANVDLILMAYLFPYSPTLPA